MCPTVSKLYAYNVTDTTKTPTVLSVMVNGYWVSSNLIENWDMIYDIVLDVPNGLAYVAGGDAWGSSFSVINITNTTKNAWLEHMGLSYYGNGEESAKASYMKLVSQIYEPYTHKAGEGVPIRLALHSSKTVVFVLSRYAYRAEHVDICNSCGSLMSVDVSDPSNATILHMVEEDGHATDMIYDEANQEIMVIDMDGYPTKYDVSNTSNL